MVEKERGIFGRKPKIIIFFTLCFWSLLLFMGTVGQNLDENTRVICGYASIVLSLIILSGGK